MADDVLAEALARIEFKLDLLLKKANIPQWEMPQLETPGQVCPVCRKTIEYQVNVSKKVVARKCGCRTGKVAPDIDLINPPVTPAAPGAKDGNHEQQRTEAGERHRGR